MMRFQRIFTNGKLLYNFIELIATSETKIRSKSFFLTIITLFTSENHRRNSR